MDNLVAVRISHTNDLIYRYDEDEDGRLVKVSEDDPSGMFLRKQVPVSRLPEEFIPFVSRVYAGGYAESLYTGSTECCASDINSLYPSIAADYPLYEPESLVEGFSLEHEGFTEAIVETADWNPILPFQNDSNAVFPNGKFSGVFTNHELRYALENTNTQIIRIIRGCHALSPLRNNARLKRRILAYYKMKKESKNEDARKKAKGILLKGLGSYDARPSYTIFVRNDWTQRFMETRRSKDWKVSGQFRRKGTKELFDVIVVSTEERRTGIFRYIASIGRTILHSYIQKCSNVIYYDTDSIFSRDSLNDKIPHGSDIGQFKVVFDGNADIYALKRYRYNNYINEERKAVIAGMKVEYDDIDSDGIVEYTDHFGVTRIQDLVSQPSRQKFAESIMQGH